MTVPATYYSSARSPGKPMEAELLPGRIQFQLAKSDIRVWDAGDLVPEELPGARKWIFRPEEGSDESLLLEYSLPLKSWAKENGLRVSFQGRRLPVFTIFILGFLILGALFVWKGIPWIADVLARKVPVEWEMELGTNISRQIEQESEIDTTKTRILQEFYGRLILPTSEREPTPIRVVVLERKEFNAFAIPGRRIFIFKGALSRIHSYPELMALIGHEAGHVVERHSVRTLFRSVSLFAVVSFFLGDLGGLAGVLVDNARSIQSLSYSRDFERDADDFAHDFLCRNHARPEAMVDLMKRMEQEAGSKESESISFLSSHPLTGERIENAETRIREFPCTSSPVADPKLNELFQALKN